MYMVSSLMCVCAK